MLDEAVPAFLLAHVEQERDFERERVKGAEQVVLALRRKLRAADPSLPDERDGTAWQVVESEFYSA